MTYGAISLPKVPDMEVCALLLWLFLPLLTSDRLDRLDLEERPDCDPNPDLDPKSVFSSNLSDLSDWVERPELVVRLDLEAMLDKSEPSDLDNSSEIEDSLVLDVISDTVDRDVVDLFCNGSGNPLTITLRKEMHIIVKHDSYMFH